MEELKLFGEPNYTGRACELCHTAECDYFPLSTFHLDNDLNNTAPDNLAIVCPPCYRHLRLAMPGGIQSSRTLFAFLINRHAYPPDVLNKNSEKFYNNSKRAHSRATPTPKP